MKIPKETTSVVGDNIGAGAMRSFSNKTGWPIAWIEIHLIYRVPALFQYGSGVVPICFVKKYLKKNCRGVRDGETYWTSHVSG
tara:strand:- start:16 stop:264 length:249 start_codon:yes stop_codon:yes gene_type:complete